MAVQPHEMFAQFLDTIAKPARQVAAQPEAFPQKPDLLTELERCAINLDIAAVFTESAYPGNSKLFATAARRVRATIARAKEFGHA